jgi:uncharacterized protein
MKLLHIIAFTLVIVGGINWGLMGLFSFNLVEWLLGESMFSQLVYILVGGAAVYLFFTHAQDCRTCNPINGK